ncbi:MAG: helix-turn-helix transcriptional regulator [Bacteroidales bacterium]|jgi:transcriptional regulator with XRE-family HTH domain
MKERLLEFLKNENKSSAQLAEEIGVQASGISHILSGRNNPSLDFVLKMLEKYQFLSTDWLLFGKGSMYKETKMQNLFDYDPENSRETNEILNKSEQIRPKIDSQDVIKNKAVDDSIAQTEKTASGIAKIVWFYENNSFEEFFPRR